MNATSVFEVSDLACVVGYRPLFSGLHLQLEAGQWIELTGPNGTGKTTLLRSLAGLTRPLAGQLQWLGKPVVPNSAQWRSELLYQGHQPALKDTLSCAENLATWLALDHGHRPTPADTLSWLDQAGIAACAHLPAASLSAGQRRRIQLARLAAANGRRLWLLDEPANALDRAGLEFLNNMLSTHLAGGGLAIVATHQPLQPAVPALELFMPTFSHRAGAPA